LSSFLPACCQAALAARGRELVSVAAELALHKERLRKGRFHIIAEQVQQAKVRSSVHVVSRGQGARQAGLHW
jgi:hypothetical protein